MSSQIIRLRETMKVTEVEDVVVSEVTMDGGRYVRTLRVYGSGGSDGPPILEVVLDADVSEKIKFDVPASLV